MNNATTIEKVGTNDNKTLFYKNNRILNDGRALYSKVRANGYPLLAVSVLSGSIILCTIAIGAFFIGKNYFLLEYSKAKIDNLIEARMVEKVDQQVIGKGIDKTIDHKINERLEIALEKPEFASLFEERVGVMTSAYLSNEGSSLDQRNSDWLATEIDEIKSTVLKDLVDDAVKNEFVHLEEYIYEAVTKEIISLREGLSETKGSLNELRANLENLNDFPNLVSKIEELADKAASEATLAAEEMISKAIERTNREMEEIAIINVEEELARRQLEHELNEVEQAAREKAVNY